MNEDDPLQLYQKFTESFNKITRNSEHNEFVAGTGSYHSEEQLSTDLHFAPEFHNQVKTDGGTFLPAAAGVGLQGPGGPVPVLPGTVSEPRLDWYNSGSFPSTVVSDPGQQYSAYSNLPSYDYEQPYHPAASAQDMSFSSSKELDNLYGQPHSMLYSSLSSVPTVLESHSGAGSPAFSQQQFQVPVVENPCTPLHPSPLEEQPSSSSVTSALSAGGVATSGVSGVSGVGTPKGSRGRPRGKKTA